jgi:hypothetical protein
MQHALYFSSEKRPQSIADITIHHVVVIYARIIQVIDQEGPETRTA